MRQNPGSVNALATKMYEDRLKLPHQRDSLDDAAMKVGILVRFLKNMSSCYLFLFFFCNLTAKIRGKCWAAVGPKSCFNSEVSCSNQPVLRVLFL